jgi:low affinity Fe/Cu permease
MHGNQKASWFTRFAKKTAQLSGRPVAFGLALGIILAWLVTGPLFGFSDTWQLVINTGATIITFLMVFLIQNTQNRGHNALMDLEELEEAEIERFRRQYEEMAARARRRLGEGATDTDSPEPS